MARAGENETESDLSALLDSALADFGRARNTDDELDSMMDTMDQQDVQKAAQKFDDVMKTFQKSSNHPVLFHVFLAYSNGLDQDFNGITKNPVSSDVKNDKTIESIFLILLI